MSDRSRRPSRAIATAAMVSACFAAAAIPAAPALGEDATRSSHRPKSVQVTGLLTLTDGDAGTYAATGDLVGTWTIPPTRAEDYFNDGTTIIQKGTESFRGCLVRGVRRCGTLNSEYISWTYLTPAKRLITGGCVHAPTGGTRGFIGVRGLLQMTDTPVGDEVNTVYTGEIILDADPKEGPEPVPAARAVAGSARAATGTC